MNLPDDLASTPVRQALSASFRLYHPGQCRDVGQRAQDIVEMRAADGAGERVEHRLAKSAYILPHHARRLHRCAGTFAKGQEQGQRLKPHQCAARLVDFGLDALFVDRGARALRIGVAVLKAGVDLQQPFRRSAEHTSALQSLMRLSYAAFCLTKQTDITSDT